MLGACGSPGPEKAARLRERVQRYLHIILQQGRHISSKIRTRVRFESEQYVDNER